MPVSSVLIILNEHWRQWRRAFSAIIMNMTSAKHNELYCRGTFFLPIVHYLLSERLTDSVTKCLEYFSLFGYLQRLEFAQNSLKIAKVGSKFCQTLNIPSKVCQRFLKLCPSGEISPNLVTLFTEHI